MGLGWDEHITREISVRVKEWFLELDRGVEGNQIAQNPARS